MITTLFYYFAQIRKVEQKLEIAKEEIFFRANLSMRLDQIFSRITPLKAEHFLYTENDPPELYCVFDNGIDPDPEFSGAVQGRISLDRQKNLLLTITPLEEKPKKKRKEILKKNVTFLEYEFLPLEWIQGETEMEQEWPKEKKKLPSMIRLEIDGMKFAFFLPTMDPVITFFDSEDK